MQKLRLALATSVLTVAMAGPALATSHTPGAIYGDLVSEATPWFVGLIAVVAGVFGLGLAIKFGKKVARMISGALGRS